MKRVGSDSITVLVFKDNFAARAFQLPLKWVSRFGLVVGALVGVTLLTTAASIRFYWLARKADPVRVLDLEQELAELREAQRKAPAAPAASTQSGTTTAVAPGTGPETAPTTATAPQTEVTPATTDGAPALLGGDLVLSPSVSPGDLPFKLDRLQARWKNGKLEVGFNFVYTKGDGGAQKGRIVILARGEKSIEAYPDTALLLKEQAPQPPQIDLKPREGEYFSVGRYREVLGSFPKIADPKDIKTAEILIYDSSLKLLLQQRIVPTGEAPAAKPPVRGRPAPRARPAAPAAPSAPAASTAEPAATTESAPASTDSATGGQR